MHQALDQLTPRPQHVLVDGLRIRWLPYNQTALVQGEAPVALRAGPTEQAVVRAMAEPGVVGRLKACREAWCEIATGGVEGWLPRGVIWGVGADETIE